MRVAYYFDHNMQSVVMEALQDLGCDVLTLQSDGYHERDDEAVLLRACSLNRVLVTHDQDFLILAHSWQSSSLSFPGIIFCDLERATIGSLVNDLALISVAVHPEELQNIVVWLPL